MFVKQQVISALGEGNFQQARPALIKTAQSELDSRVRRSARLALERLDVGGAAKPNSTKGKTWLQGPLPNPGGVPQQALVSGSPVP